MISLRVCCVLMKLSPTLVWNQSKLIGVTGGGRRWLDTVQIYNCRVTPDNKYVKMLICCVELGTGHPTLAPASHQDLRYYIWAWSQHHHTRDDEVVTAQPIIDEILC